MKKFFTFVVMAVFASAMMMAEWHPSDVDAIQLDKEGADGQVQMKTLMTPEGNIVLTWLRGERVDNVFSYQLHLQVFDADGNAKFGDEGIIVCDKATRTWTTDYGLALADNGDILMAYTDVRTDPEDQYYVYSYLYRYNQQGEPVWDVDGVLFPSQKLHDTAFGVEDVAPQICVSGNNIYAAVNHTEYYREKATEDNWSPSPWFPNQQMPDSVDVTDAKWMVVSLNQDGTVAREEPMTIASKILVMKPSTGGNIYFVYDNEYTGLDAQMLNSELTNNWGEPITIEDRVLSSGMYMPTPLTEVDEEGGLFLSYRVLNSFTGFQVLNHLTPNGDFLYNAPSCNGTEDGDAGSAAMGVKFDMAMVAWEYDFGSYFMNVNVLDASGNFCWPDDYFFGRSLDENNMWGMTPVKVIPQEDGWVLLYGNLQSWNGANFMVVKIDDVGETVWSKQICEDNFKSSGFSVVYDDMYAYIFYTQEVQYDDNWEEIPGSAGMYVMCVQIGEDKISSVGEVAAAGVQTTEIYTIDGRRVNQMENGVNIIRTIDENGKVTVKKVMK